MHDYFCYISEWMPDMYFPGPPPDNRVSCDDNQTSTVLQNDKGLESPHYVSSTENEYFRILIYFTEFISQTLQAICMLNVSK